MSLMLQANSLQLKASGGQLITIAGATSGKKVACSSQALPVYNKLLALADIQVTTGP
jgi:hypothetical protein